MLFLRFCMLFSSINIIPLELSIVPKEGLQMDLKAVGLRIKEAREEKNLTQENLAAIVDLSTTHISVIERGLKTMRLDNFVAIANALDVSADSLLSDVVTKSTEAIRSLPSDEQNRLTKALRAYLE